jgi:putative flippase GtrA
MKEFLLQKRRFVFYCLIGASGVGLDFGVYSLLVKTGLFDYQAANAVGYSSGTLLSFFLNARYNFRVTDRIALRLACFFGVAFVGWLASAVTLHLLIEILGWDKYQAKAATLAIVVLLQYNLNRLISFRKTHG